MAKQNTQFIEKRYKITGTGKVLRAQAYKKHILTKNQRAQRNLRKTVVATPADAKIVKSCSHK